jgi:LysM repeat protein
VVAEPGARRWLARVVAPVALLVAATIAILLVRDALRTADERSTPTRPAATTGSRPASPPPPAPVAAPEYYRVRSGDTLTSIAGEYGTTVERLLTLNPGVDPAALTVGQRIRVG